MVLPNSVQVKQEVSGDIHTQWQVVETIYTLFTILECIEELLQILVPTFVQQQ